MTHIQIDPMVVRETGNKIKTKKDELQGIIEEAKRVMDSLRDGFKGKRSQAIFSEWEQIHPTLAKSFENLQRAAQLLESAANQFEEVDNVGSR
jgi:WXG100 family type VII secretion target